MGALTNGTLRKLGKQPQRTERPNRSHQKWPPRPKRNWCKRLNVLLSHPSNQAALTFLANADVAGHVSTELELARARFLHRVGSLWAAGITEVSGLSTEASSGTSRPRSENTKKMEFSGKTLRANVTVAAGQPGSHKWQRVRRRGGDTAFGRGWMRRRRDGGWETRAKVGGWTGGAGHGLDGLEVSWPGCGARRASAFDRPFCARSFA